MSYAATVVQGLEAAAAGPGGVEVDDELIDDFLERRQVPTAAADPLDLFRREAGLPHPEPDGRLQHRSAY